MNHMKWSMSGYAGRQLNDDRATGAGQTPVKLFYKNYCTTAMHSLNTSDGISQCLGVTTDGGDLSKIVPVHSIAPAPEHRVVEVEVGGNKVNKNRVEMYYPNITTGNRIPTVCQDGSTNCGNLGDRFAVAPCDNTTTDRCGTTVIDNYTTSFHWAETNFSAVWLRTPGWFLMTDSFISDVQNGGVTLVSGGDYSRSSTPTGYWALVSRSIFVGATQPKNPFAYASGPRKDNKEDAETGCSNSTGVDSSGKVLGLCVRKDQSIYFPLSNWATGQRFFNIYDGPAHQAANAYLDINVSDCGSTAATDDEKKKCMYLGTPGVRKFRTAWGKKNAGGGYLPNAAIGWKQPNGFFYPPAFHSRDLFFDNVDIRHYVIQPLYKPGTYYTDDTRVQDEFLGIKTGTTGLMTGFTDVDRQTELTDDDGTLTGFAATGGPEGTISVNEDGFFAAPLQAAQCKSNPGVTPAAACATSQLSSTPPTARTSP